LSGTKMMILTKEKGVKTMISIKKIFYLFAIIALLAMSPSGSADHADFPDIYIDGTTGGVGSEADPLSAFSDINWTTGGDNSVYDAVAAGKDVTINLKRGVTWRETMTVGTSGSAAHPITIKAYGSGADPIISAFDVLTSWTEEATSGENFTDGTGTTMEAYWLFEDTNWLDETANNNDLTATGTISLDANKKEGTYSAKLENANSEQFNITDANCSSGFPGKSGEVTTDFTYGMWVNFWEDPADLAGQILTKRGGLDGWYLDMLSSKFRFGAYDAGDAWDVIYANDACVKDTWYHVVIRWKGSTDDELAMFVNGVKQNSPGTLTNLAESNGDFIIGANPWGSNASILVDEVFVCSSALTDGQIADIYAFGLSGGSGTPIHYKAMAAEPTIVLEDSTRLTEVAAKLSLTVGTYWWDAGNTRLYVKCTGDDAPSNYTMQASVRDWNIHVPTDYIQFDSIVCDGSKLGGINVQATATHTTIQNCDFNYGYRGVNTWNGSSYTIVDTCTANHSIFAAIALASDNDTIQGCTLQNGGFADLAANGFGVYISNGDSALIQDNTVHDSKNSNILITSDAGSGIIIRRNHCYNTTDYFNITVELLNVETNPVEIYYNICHDAGNTGIYIDGGDGSKIYNNVIYNNGYHGLYIDDRNDHIVKNNIFSGNTQQDIKVDAGLTGVTFDNNCYYRASGNIIHWQGTDYSIAQFATYQSASSQDVNSLAQDPLMTDPGNGDFALQAGSPCINAGTNVGLTEDYAGNIVGALPDIGAYEYQANAKGRMYLILNKGYFIPKCGEIIDIFSNGHMLEILIVIKKIY